MVMQIFRSTSARLMAAHTWVAHLHYPLPSLQESEEFGDERVQVRREQVLITILREVDDRRAGVCLHSAGCGQLQHMHASASAGQTIITCS